MSNMMKKHVLWPPVFNFYLNNFLLLKKSNHLLHDSWHKNTLTLFSITLLNIIIYAQFCEKEKNHMWIVKKKGENSWICDISSVKKLTTVIDNCNEKTMRHIELSVQQKCTLFLFVIAAIHVGGLIWILVSEDL